MGKMEDFIDKTRKVQSECGTLSQKKKKKSLLRKNVM